MAPSSSFLLSEISLFPPFIRKSLKNHKVGENDRSSLVLPKPGNAAERVRYTYSYLPIQSTKNHPMGPFLSGAPLEMQPLWSSYQRDF
jgi:hypothetical protein